MAKQTYPDGNVIDYTYTARNQLKEVQNGGPPPVATYAYDLAGRLTNLDRDLSRGTEAKWTTEGSPKGEIGELGRFHQNGVNTVLTHGTAAGELTAVDHAKGANYVDGVLYALNANNGRREGITRSGGWNDAYGYDAAGQVTGASYAANTTGMGSEGFTYDAAGNRTSSVKNGTNVTEYAPNTLDQYSAIGGVSQAHDANGNLTTFVPPVAGALPITMKWDGENRLTEMTKTGHKVTNVYDALHRRILKKIHDDDTEVIAKTIAFVYDGWNVIQETEYAGSTTTVVSQKRYTWGADVSGSLQGAGGVGGLLVAEETVLSGTTQITPIPHYYHYDGNGNVIAITDATGTTEGRYRYTAFGGAANTVTNTTFAATQSYRFSTKYLDKEVETAEGTYFYGFRHYVPVIGRWPSRDPIGELGGSNLYGMVGNATISFVDYLGLLESDTSSTQCTDGERRNCKAKPAMFNTKAAQAKIMVGLFSDSIYGGVNALLTPFTPSPSVSPHNAGFQVANAANNRAQASATSSVSLSEGVSAVHSYYDTLENIAKSTGKKPTQKTDDGGLFASVEVEYEECKCNAWIPKTRRIFGIQLEDPKTRKPRPWNNMNEVQIGDPALVQKTAEEAVCDKEY